MKQQILETLGFSSDEQFPVFADRFPNQLLAYLRLSRVADPALFAKVRRGRAWGLGFGLGLRARAGAVVGQLEAGCLPHEAAGGAWRVGVAGCGPRAADGSRGAAGGGWLSARRRAASCCGPGARPR